MPPIEIWKPITGYDGYEVSNAGSVRSSDRVVETLKGPRFYRGRLRKLSIGNNGYLVVSLSLLGKIKVALVHRLVLEAFVGPCPEGTEGCHNDGDRLNCNSYNLRWDTRLANIRDQEIHGTRARGEQKSKWSEDQIRDVKRRLLLGHGTTRIGRDTGIPKETVNSIKFGKSWGHLSA